MDLRIHMGSTMLVSGPTSSGKTVFILKLIEAASQLFDASPTQVYWCYGTRTAAHDFMVRKGFTMINGIPRNFEFLKANDIVVLDDLMVQAKNSEAITELFTL